MRHPPSVILLLLFFVSLHATAGSLRRVPQQYRTIQAAINAARPADTVIVEHGLYYENLRITKNIVLGSRFIIDHDTSHISRTIVDGSMAKDKLRGSTIFISGPTDTTCVVKGLTIRGGTGSHIHYPSGPANFTDWIVGGGIFILNAGVRISSNIITQNSVNPVGKFTNTGSAGISSYCKKDKSEDYPYAIIEHNIVTKNSASGSWSEVSGIGIEQPAIVRHNTVTDNRTIARTRAPGGGIGIYFNQNYSIIVDGNDVRRNTAGLGGGIIVGAETTQPGRAILVNNIIAENSAIELGGGIHVAENADVLIINNTIVGNRALVDGDALNVGSGGLAILLNNILWGNTPRPISSLSTIFVSHNIFGGNLAGVNVLVEDPRFETNDSTYRLSASSPAIGLGANDIVVFGKRITAPSHDFDGNARPRAGEGRVDLGAVESPLLKSNGTGAILDQWDELSENRIKLTYWFRQTTSIEFNPDSFPATKAGKMEILGKINDTIPIALANNGAEEIYVLPPDDNCLEIELIAQSRSGVRPLLANLLLDGSDPVYHSLIRRRNHIYRCYPGIPPGRYTLHLYVKDEEGLMDPANTRSVTIIVPPYWYQRWWAYGLLGLLVGGLVVVMTRIEVRRLRQDRQRQRAFSRQQLEVQESERRRVASELHDGLGQDLLIAKNELARLEGRFALPSEDVRLLRDVVSESLDAVRELSSNLHPHQIDQLGFCAAVRSMAKKLETTTGIKIICDCELNGTIRARETTIHLYRIIQESLTNAVKHASASEIRVDVHESTGKLEISVRDNGKGFDSSLRSSATTPDGSIAQRKGFGIVSMSERARIIGGSFSCHSSSGQGTTIRVTLPIEGA